MYPTAPPARQRPIRSAADALALVHAARHHPPVDETLAFLLDDAGHGNSIVIVAGTTDPDAVCRVTECLASVGAGIPELGRLVVATVRPGGGLLPGDIDRWYECSDIADVHGVQLLEWFVIGDHDVDSPRDLIGEPERWYQRTPS